MPFTIILTLVVGIPLLGVSVYLLVLLIRALGICNSLMLSLFMLAH